ncbi:MAG TPA: hypothetical protein VF476_17395 [Chitinophagaceae bacterium]
MKKKENPVIKKEDIARHPDKKIDQDFEGYPHGPATDKTIKPRTQEEKETADVYNKDGEKRIYRKNGIDEQDSDGSANAFEGK